MASEKTSTGSKTGLKGKRPAPGTDSTGPQLITPKKTRVRKGAKPPLVKKPK